MDNQPLNNKNQVNRKNTILLTIIGIATLLIAIVGATFAYFSVTLSGDTEGAGVNVGTANYGSITVDFTDAKDSISIANANLLQVNAGDETSYPSDYLTFSIQNTGNVAQLVNVSFSTLTNSFCHFLKTDGITCSTTAGYTCVGGTATGDETTSSECDGVSGTWTAWTDVSDELYWVFSTCTSNDYSSCSQSATENFGYAAQTIKANISLAASSTTYYKLEAFIKNKNSNQNYNQGKTISATASISVPAS